MSQYKTTFCGFGRNSLKWHNEEHEFNATSDTKAKKYLSKYLKERQKEFSTICEVVLGEFRSIEIPEIKVEYHI